MNHRLPRIRRTLSRLMLGVAVLAAALTVAGVAGAHRGAVAPELRAMVYHSSGRYYGGAPESEPRSAPLKCFRGVISTVVKGSQWGAWTWTRFGLAPADETKCRAANGISIEHKIKGRWYVIWEGDEGYPPTHPLNEGAFTLQPVPRAVAKDLVRGLGGG